MGFKGCQIQMNKPYNTYCPGETISGSIIYTIETPKKVCGICVKLLGKGRIRFPGISEKGNEEYVKIKCFVLGKKFGDEIKLQPGRYTYSFSYTLPQFIPTSFEGRAGSIRYTIRVIRYEHWNFHNDKKIVFTIISPVNLNLYSHIKNPYNLELKKNFNWLCGGYGSITLNICLPLTGFIPGQKIIINAECLNFSSIHVSSIKFKLRVLINYHLIISPVKRIPARIRSDILKINELNFGSLGPNDSKRWCRKLNVPSIHTCNWNLDYSKLFDLKYEILVTVQIPFPHTNLTGTIPIIIGSIPFNQSLNNYNQRIEPLLISENEIFTESPTSTNTTITQSANYENENDYNLNSNNLQDTINL